MTGAFGFDPARFIGEAPPTAEVRDIRPMPVDWAHGLRLLADRLPPRGATEGRWTQILSDAARLATRYQEDVITAGWNAANLFGFDLSRDDEAVGLAVAMRGRMLVKITAEEAVLKGVDSYFIHRPRMPHDAPLLWSFKECR